MLFHDLWRIYWGLGLLLWYSSLFGRLRLSLLIFINNELYKHSRHLIVILSQNPVEQIIIRVIEEGNPLAVPLP
jgi:hypothetical protein